MKIVWALACLGFALVLCGCSAGPKYCPYCGADLSKSPRDATETLAPAATQAAAAAPAPMNAGASGVFQIPPQTLFDRLQAVLKADGFAIASASAGAIETDWRSYEGEFHLLRRWEEQSRFRIVVVPDISAPTAAARIDITEQTQRRSNPRANWQAADARPERVRQLRQQLEGQLK